MDVLAKFMVQGSSLAIPECNIWPAVRAFNTGDTSDTGCGPDRERGTDVTDPTSKDECEPEANTDATDRAVAAEGSPPSVPAGLRTAGASTDGSREIGGPSGPEPTRYGDWERRGIVSDF
jgi:hypothetical protein